MDIRTEVLRQLKKADEYVSGQEICDKCNVSRTAVWKIINRLKEEGYDIDSVTNKGYRVVSYPDVLSKSEIESELSDSNFVREVVYLDETDSTNTRAKLMGEEGAPDGTLVAADSQTGGRGRRGRDFKSPAGESIYMTLLIRPDFTPDKASMLTIVTALAVHKAIKECCDIDTGIKWPNDIVMDGKKISGILTEMSAEFTVINYVAIGIGINVNNEEMPEEIRDVAASLKMASGKKYRRSMIIASVIKWFNFYYDKFCVTMDLSELMEEYNNNLIHMNREVEIIKENKKYRAKSLGINNDGELIIENDGILEKVVSGEVSVRGVYGYV